MEGMMRAVRCYPLVPIHKKLLNQSITVLNRSSRTKCGSSCTRHFFTSGRHRVAKVVLAVGVTQVAPNLQCQTHSLGPVRLLEPERKTFLEALSLVLAEVIELCRLLCRTIYLLCIYIPIFAFYPISMCGSTFEELWWSAFLKGIEVSGPIFIKLGQWASTRPDIFSKETCAHLGLLQRQITPHSWFYTKQQLRRAFGDNWSDIFYELDPVPIGSGCIAQVYKAHINADYIALDADRVKDYNCSLDVYEVLDFIGIGKLLSWNANSCTSRSRGNRSIIPVAVKVLHPGIERQFQRDLSIMQCGARLITKVFPSLDWLSPIECVDDFKQLMSSQINLKVEAVNLDHFTKNFEKNPLVKFPTPLWPYVTNQVMVESFEEGSPISSYISPDTCATKSRLANIGVEALLNMIFVHNFVHGDLHPGNLLVQTVDLPKPERSPREGWLPWRRHKASHPDEPLSLRLVILDCGITTRLSKRDQKNLKDVFTAIVNRNGRLVAELFLARSPHRCLNVEGFKTEMAAIINAALDKTVSLGTVEVSRLLQQLFSCLLNYNVKLEGKFTSVFLAVMVLEGLGRSLDPNLDILEKAKPLLLSIL